MTGVFILCKSAKVPSACMHAHSVLSNSLQPIDYSPPGSSVHGLSRQEYWSGLSFSTAGDLSNPGIELAFLKSPALAVGFFFFFYHCSIWEAWRYQGWASTLFCISNRRTELFLCQWLGFTDEQKMCLFHFGAECLQLITGTLMIQWWGWSLELIKRRPWPRLPQHWTPFLEIFLSAPWCQGAARTGSAVWADGSESGQDPLGS